jgi:hypothetical protein
MAEQPSSALPGRPKPHLVRLFAAIGAILGFDAAGGSRLELIFEGRHLRLYCVHHERHGATAQVEYDARVAHLVARTELAE